MPFESKRRFLKSTGAFALVFGYPGLLRAAVDCPIADSHSHIGLFSAQLRARSLKAEMEEAGVMLLSWSGLSYTAPLERRLAIAALS